MAQAQQGAGDAQNTETLEAKRQKVESLMAEMKTWRTEAELLQQSLDQAHNATLPLPERLLAMKLMRELVEQVDVANGAMLDKRPAIISPGFSTSTCKVACVPFSTQCLSQSFCRHYDTSTNSSERMQADEIGVKHLE